MRWRRPGKSGDVIDARGGGGMPGGRMAIPGGLGVAGVLLFLVIRVQDTWEEIFQRSGRQYQRAKLVLYRGGVSTACGSASSAVGPFYCPGDERVYIDLAFYRELKSRFRAPGDFAQAYVIAHE